MITWHLCEWLENPKVSISKKKHNTSYVSKSGIVSNTPSHQAGNDKQDTMVPMQEPW